MLIKSLDLDNFRNYERLHMEFSPGTTILYGENAQGKTNILEAVSLAFSARSHRNAKDREMIRKDAEEAHIKLIAEKNRTEYRIDLHLKRGGHRGIAVNSVPLRRSADYLGTLKCVIFSPEDLQLVKEGPQERRRFIDAELCQLDRIYLNALIRYKKALEQRNQLLKDVSFEPSLMDTLDIWEEQLVSAGKEIIKRRKDFIEELSGITAPVHEKISGGKEHLKLLYEPDVAAEDFQNELFLNRGRDLKNKTTSVGPHRDDMAFDLDGMDARIYGSQGQQRTSALSIKLAEIELVKKKSGEYPVLLLDDVMSELDAGRQNDLLKSITGVQTLISCTGMEDFLSHGFQADEVYRIKNGTAAPYERE
ncbi:MAG: DNA replication/repair protein RecF [Lachnospiraceae bacterium]|nr:DNA replication/repair protein RecF [Lachnospiraceae bacterium]